MRKGDEKRQELLDTAEKLFCLKGYEATSVQDILDALHLSKGGFYHHFASKEEVLRALCTRHAERSAAYAAQALHAAGSPMARINVVLNAFVPLRKEETVFLYMLLPGIQRPEGRAIAMAYQDALMESFLPLLKAEIAAAAAVQAVCPPVRELETVILHVVNHCWIEAAEALYNAVQEGVRADRLMLLSLLEKYRRAVEVLLDAPYGSIEVIRIEEWCRIADELRLLQN